MRIIGLTGGVASGKSTVASLLRGLGATVVDADEATRAVEAAGQPALAEISDALGSDVLAADGSLNRARVAEIVFRDEASRRRLEEIVHPRVREWMTDRVAEAAIAGIESVVMDIPLLYENGLDGGMHEVMVVWCPVETQVQRAIARGLTEVDARARIAAQMPLDEKRRRTARVIDNSGDLAETERQVTETWAEISGTQGPTRLDRDEEPKPPPT